MFCDACRRMLASMNAPEWSDLGLSGLPTGTVTLLLADVEGSTRLWETRPEEMSAAIARLDRAVTDAIAAHDGVRPVEQGEGDSFVIAFARASDAVACALALQRAPLAPIRLRIGVHTGEVRLRDEGNYIGPTINRTARLRDLGHGGQTVLSSTTGDLVVDELPPDAWLSELGAHTLRDLPRPERVMQLCHPDVRVDFPPLRTSESLTSHNLPVQLTSFVGRQAEMSSLREALAANRLVTLTGAGGVGKTRLAVHVAADMAGECGDGVWYVDLAPITHPDLVPITAARALGLPDQPGRSTIDTLTRFIGNRQMLLVLDNCEHLLDATAALVVVLVEACPRVRLLATSREPIGVAGEVSWRVPSLSLADEAIQLFTDRARRVRPDFSINDQTSAAVNEICTRLDGLPLAIELAAARVRALSPEDILDGLHDRFRLLTGGARTAVRRQQTLRASVDWSHTLLTEPERVLFRRLAVFLGGFDLDAAQAVAGGSDVQRYQVLDQLTLLVDKSLVLAETACGRTRYRLLETVRQYAQEKLDESGESEAVRTRHCDYYTSMAVLLDAPPTETGHEQLIEHAEEEMDNLRSAFGWSLEVGDAGRALELASSLQPLWLSRNRAREGLAWLESGLTHQDTVQTNPSPTVRLRAVTDKALLTTWAAFTAADVEEMDRVLTLARELGDQQLLIRALMARGLSIAHDMEASRPYLAEAAARAREVGDSWRLSQILGQQTVAALPAGDLTIGGAIADEALRIADAVGDRFTSLECRYVQGWARAHKGDVIWAAARFRAIIEEAAALHEEIVQMWGFLMEGYSLALLGDAAGARASGDAMLPGAWDLGEFGGGPGYSVRGIAGLARGDGPGAFKAYEEARQRTGLHPFSAGMYSWSALAPLACGDLATARRWADEVVSLGFGCYLPVSLTTRARVEIAQGELEQAERDAHDALSRATDSGAFLAVPDTLECLAELAARAESHREAARLFGAADAARESMGIVRLKILDPAHESWVATLRDCMGDKEFESAWVEGAALSIEAAIAYAQRGRVERKRPASGWASLTPAELDVVRLVVQGLANKAIATRLFVSPRTVQAHLTHVYTKLGITSRVQLVNEAARHS